MKSNPIVRKCIATGAIRPKEELIRIVLNKDGQFYISTEKKGRGAYISKDIKDISIIKKRKVLNRAFKIDVPNEVYNELLKQIEKEK